VLNSKAVIAVGARVGNYQVQQLLGEGAMGKVFLAEHPVIGKRVALKVIHPELADNEEMIARFFNEARAVTQIGHENIVEVQDFGQTPDGDNFIVMELLEGRGLGTVMKAEGMLSVPRATHIGLQLADGLAAAHARGIIHRDLKPDNIFLITRGGDPDFVKILDFGLAKLSGPAAGLMANKTKTGSLLGTPHYMAPEQCEGRKDIDHRVDVYALGCILFHMLTGRVPFPGEGFGEVLVKQLREPPPLPTRLNPQVPDALEKIILHALAKKPDFRFKSMDEFRSALRDPGRFAMELDAGAGIRLTPGEGLPAPVMPSSSGGGGGAPVVASPRNAPSSLPSDAATVIGQQTPAAVEAVLRARGANGANANPAQTAPGQYRQQKPTTAQPHIKRRGPAPSSGRGLLIGIVAGTLALAAIGILVLALRSRGGNVAVTVVTTPAGAQVLRGGEVAGVTPLVLKLPRGDAPVELTIQKDGFLAAKRSITPGDDQEVKVRLLPKQVEEASADEPRTTKTDDERKTPPPSSSKTAPSSSKTAPSSSKTAPSSSKTPLSSSKTASPSSSKTPVATKAPPATKEAPPPDDKKSHHSSHKKKTKDTDQLLLSPSF
jgi:eukaryotic-like serine/threonine-protein kinase